MDQDIQNINYHPLQMSIFNLKKDEDELSEKSKQTYGHLMRRKNIKK